MVKILVGIPQVCVFVVRVPIGIPQALWLRGIPQALWRRGQDARIPVGIPQVLWLSGQDPGCGISQVCGFVVRIPVNMGYLKFCCVAITIPVGIPQVLCFGGQDTGTIQLLSIPIAVHPPRHVLSPVTSRGRLLQSTLRNRGCPCNNTAPTRSPEASSSFCGARSARLLFAVSRTEPHQLESSCWSRIARTVPQF